MIKDIFSKRSNIPNPFDMYSRDMQPTELHTIFDLCEMLWSVSGQFRMAMQRTARYFITKVTVSGVNGDEQRRIKEYLYDQLHVIDLLCNIVDDFCWYGNSLSTIIYPVDRTLVCPHCKYRANIRVMKSYSLDTATMKFRARCLMCQREGLMQVVDQRSQDENRINITRWDPRLMEILHNPLTADDSYITTLPPEILDGTRSNHRHIMESTPWEYIVAAAKGQRFGFAPGAIHHMKEPVLAGIPTRGWGIPRLLPAIGDVWNLQMLKRANQAICGSYIMPYRFIGPGQSQSGDPALGYDLSQYTSHLERAVARHREDPASISVLPFPVTYTPVSGEGKNITPWELIKQSSADLYDSMGIPVELYQGTMNIATAPTAARLFESQWPHMVHGANAWLDWVASSISKAFGWPKAKLTLEPPAITDDLNRIARLTQYRAAGDVSRATAYRADNIDPESERKQIINEQLEDAQAQQEFQQDQANRQQLTAMISSSAGSGSSDSGGAPGMTGSGVVGANATPQDIMAQAQQIAQQLMGMPEAARRSQLIQLKNQNPMLHHAVKGELDNIRIQAGSQGVQQAYASAQGQQ